MGTLSTEQGESLLDEGGNILTTESFDPGGSLASEDGAILLSEDGQELVTEDYVASVGEVVGNVFQPDIQITSQVTTSYDPTWVVQPPTTTTFQVSSAYTPPPSTGGQPSVVSRFRSVVVVDAPYPAYEVEGLGNITYTTVGRAELVIPPLPPVEALVNPEEYRDIIVVSVSMPKPASYDRFGRPTG